MAPIDDAAASRDRWVVTVDGLRVRSLNAGLRREDRRQSARRVRSERKVVTDFLRSRVGLRPPPLPLVVRLVRLGPQPFDFVNNVGSLKAVQDAVAAYLGVTDRDPRVVWGFDQETVSRTRVPLQKYAVRIEIATIHDA